MGAYDCGKCPGYCCAYPIIQLTADDVARLAAHLGVPEDAVLKRYLKTDHGHERILRRKADPIYGRICKLFDTHARTCTVYEARPDICRAFPGDGRCGYYDFLQFERDAQGDPDHVAVTSMGEWR